MLQLYRRMVRYPAAPLFSAGLGLALFVPLAVSVAQDYPQVTYGAYQDTGDTARAYYTAEQAAWGDYIFHTACSGCHGYAIFEQFANYTNADLFYSKISLTMPWEDAGLLPQKDYISILAYMMRESGFPAGDTELTADRELLRQIIPREGMQGLHAEANSEALGLTQWGVLSYTVAQWGVLSYAENRPTYEREYEVRQFFGKVEFEREWVPSPSTSTWDGLGPLFTDASCQSCHRGAALAGRFLESSGRVSTPGLVVRFGDANGVPDPLYGMQLQTRATEYATAEGQFSVDLPNGMHGPYELNVRLALGDLAEGVVAAPLMTPAVVGRGAIEKVDVAAIVALAEEQAARDDAISGIVRWINVPNEGEFIGLFGYKSAQHDLFHQNANAFSIDMGISSRVEPAPYGECTAMQAECIEAPHGDDGWRGGVEITDRELDTIVAYLTELPAPAQTNADLVINADFTDTGCASCHVPRLPAKDGGEVVLFSDLLLHDMGPDLDSGIGADGVLSSEWRTTPLLAMAPYTGRRYLHDGQAHDIDTAIRAHGGEAEDARLAYEQLSEEARQNLIAFIESL